MMKRNLVSWFKFLVLAAFTVFLTILIFRLVRAPRSHNNHHHHHHAAAATTAIGAAAGDSRIFLPAHQESFDSPPNSNKESEIESLLEPQVSDDKIDWHDYAKIAAEKSRHGIGEHGKPAELPKTMNKLKDKLYKVNGFNAALSDIISVNRSIPDIRHPDCKVKRHLKNLDPVSVIVSFHNEHFSTLMRTCWSVINRSPSSLLREIILVDDASTKIELKDKLDVYIRKNFGNQLVKVVRLARRSGLIRGRLAGAKRASASVLVFLDSHSEANVNWLPPLLEPIARDYKTCVCPFIDVIAYETFEYRAQDEGARGAFDWELYYKRLPLLPDDLSKPSEPFKSPIMAGGLFAISTKFFWELGGYDPGLDIWGGEQYELSFKIWQCGGQMLDAPCSRVGHIYRKFPPFPNPGRGDFLGKNYKRVADVWMDEYAEFIYKRKPHLRALDPGDISEQKALRERLHCKSFKWFIENVAFDLVEIYPPIEPDEFAYGEIRSIGAPNLCLNVAKRTKESVDGKNDDDEDVVGVQVCQSDNPKNAAAGVQEFSFTWHKDIRPGTRSDCLDVSRGDDHAPVTLYPCHGKQGNQLWRYDVEKQWLLHGYGPRCLDVDPASKTIFVASCEANSATQKWRVEHVNMQAMNNWDNVVMPVSNTNNKRLEI